MNSMMNIAIRVNATQARAQIAELQAALRTMGGTGGAGAAGAGLAGASAGVAGLNKGLVGGMSNLEKFGKNVQWTGRQLEYNFTLPILLAAGASTKFALDNEKAMVNVRKVYGDL